MKANLRRFRSVGAILFANLDGWIRNPRTFLMVLFTLLVSFMTVKGYGERIVIATQCTVHHDEFIAWYLMTGFNSFALTSLTFLVMVTEIPRRIPFQQYTIIRSSRCHWIGTQILYCLMLVVIMILTLILLAIVFSLPYITPGSGWSSNFRIVEGVEEEIVLIPEWIRIHFTPPQAILLATLPILFFWFVMVLSVLLFSLLGIPSVGVSIYAIVLFSSLIFVFENFQDFEPPMTFSFLTRIVYQYEDRYVQRLTSVFSVHGVLSAGLITFILLVARRIDIPTYSLQKN